MRNKINDNKAKEASDKAVIVSVTEEMDRPRMAESAKITTDK